MTSAFIIAKGRKTLIDLTELELEYFKNENKKIFMFLSLTWCIISDIDINSEILRWMGSTRFTIYGVYRLMSVRHY